MESEIAVSVVTVAVVVGFVGLLLAIRLLNRFDAARPSMVTAEVLPPVRSRGPARSRAMMDR
ncbi:hypothetical protein BOX37_22745 [Nocardia mangyaensis]|uniref:Uncharacterized protein n=1 Tax=Nocardia mangyaensis TaxID=2213200 RepID=A0A1J0VW83_9NOCA|nr:hypothetical protein BOX37_22745 [Nocardia mangyaensis]